MDYFCILLAKLQALPVLDNYFSYSYSLSIHAYPIALKDEMEQLAAR